MVCRRPAWSQVFTSVSRQLSMNFRNTADCAYPAGAGLDAHDGTGVAARVDVVV